MLNVNPVMLQPSANANLLGCTPPPALEVGNGATPDLNDGKCLVFKGQYLLLTADMLSDLEGVGV